MKEKENIDKYLDLARELKKQSNMNVMVILIVGSMTGIVPQRTGETVDQRKWQCEGTCCLLWKATSWIINVCNIFFIIMWNALYLTYANEIQSPTENI